MADLLHRQLDYVFLLSGLGFGILAAIASGLARGREERLPWVWLALFGIVQAIHEWMRMVCMSLGDGPEFLKGRAILTTTGFLLLIEFGRRATSVMPRGSWPRRWWSLLLVLTALAMLGNSAVPLLDAGIRYAFGLTGGLWAAWALWGSGRRAKHAGTRFRFTVAACALAAYGLIAGPLCPALGHVLSPVPVHGTVLKIARSHAHLLEGVIGAVLAAAMWRHYCRARRESLWQVPGADRLGRDRRTVTAILAVLVLGWAATVMLGNGRDRDERLRLMALTRNAAVNLPPLTHLAAAPADANHPDYLALRRHLVRIRTATQECRFAYVLVARDGKAVFLADSEPEGSKDFSPPGEVYEEASPQLLESLHGGRELVEGPISDRWGTWVSAIVPLRDPATDRPVAVLGQNINASQWAGRVGWSRLGPILIILLLSVLLLTFFAIQQENRQVQLEQAASLNRIGAQQTALVRLATSHCLDRGGLRAAFAEITEVAARTLGVERVSLWLGSHEEGQIQCADLYEDSKGGHSEGMVLQARRHPKYFEALSNGRILEAQDVQEDPRVSEFRLGYFDVFGIASLLDAPIRSSGRIVGIVSFQHVGAARPWRTDEGRFAGEIADYAAQVLLNAERRRAEEAMRLTQFSVDHAADAIFWIGPDAAIRYANGAACRLLGRPAEELSGRGIHDVGLDLLPGEWPAHWQELRQKGSLTFESRLRTAEGIARDVEIMATFSEFGGRQYEFAFVRDITSRKAMEEELRSAALTDRLTGLPNRSLLNDRIGQAIGRHRRCPDARFAVLFIDLDRFKIINDSLGHQAGDRLLVETARRLREDLREVDSVIREGPEERTAARLGGDEFIVLLENLRDLGDAEAVAQRLLGVLSRPISLGEQEVRCSASIGIVTSDIPFRRPEEVIRDADTAMYEAKQAGRGRWARFDVSMRRRVLERLSIENDLRKALEADQFVLHYQPIVSLATGAVQGFEALLRWNHPRRGLVMPGDFIAIAEESGLIVPIGEWVLRQVCQQWARWRQGMGPAAPHHVSANLSRVQVMLPDLPDRVASILAETGAEPEAIHLEITESAVMQDPKRASEVLREIKRLGVRLEADDFGTGYSSLACLHQFPFDVLKIDRSFVADLERGPEVASLVKAIVTLSHHLGISVVAEGVETPGQASLLKSMGCPFAQGYLFARPMPAEEAIRFRPPPASPSADAAA